MSLIMIVEDDESLGATLTERLAKEGHTVTWRKDRSSSTQALKEGSFDLVILDVGLPDGSGMDLARELRLSGQTVPIIFLSAFASAEYRLEGYELGADDYVPKPFHLRELLLKVEKILKPETTGKTLKFGAVTVDYSRLAISSPNHPVEYISTADMQMLKTLIEASPKPVSREELLNSLGRSDSGSLRSIDNAIVRLRQIWQKFGMEPIRSVRGLGYQWILESL